MPRIPAAPPWAEFTFPCCDRKTTGCRSSRLSELRFAFSKWDDWLFNSPLAFVGRYGRQLFSTPALGCAIHFVPVTPDAAITLTAWELLPSAPWLAPLGPDSLCEGPKWLEPKLRRKL
jgi:hypothetical protein